MMNREKKKIHAVLLKAYFNCGSRCAYLYRQYLFTICLVTNVVNTLLREMKSYTYIFIVIATL